MIRSHGVEWEEELSLTKEIPLEPGPPGVTELLRGGLLCACSLLD